ncbi:MAG: DTW domain-containing protein [Planctomycetes bacterium]|nr:DTW domain-containing protein [Planctomycetota bacterium]
MAGRRPRLVSHPSPHAHGAPEFVIRIPCVRCLKPKSTCYCSEVQPFHHPVRFVILQHLREARNSLGTGRMTHLSLTHSELWRGCHFEEDPRLRALVDDVDARPVVLYPGDRAACVSPERRGELRARFDRPPTVLVLDGTWPQAKKMLRESPTLQRLPWIAFPPDRRSEYRIRLQPDPLCLSTIEAVFALIQAFERCGLYAADPIGAQSRLLDLFRGLNETQLRYMNDLDRSGDRHRSRVPARPAKRWEHRRLLFGGELGRS